MSSSAVVKERWGNAWEGHLELSDHLEQASAQEGERPLHPRPCHGEQRTPLFHHHLRSEESPTANVGGGGASWRAQTPGSQFPFHKWSPTFTCRQQRRRLRPVCTSNTLSSNIRSLPCRLGEVSKSWEDPTRSDVTCRDPTWTSPSPSVHSYLGSSQRRRAPGGVPCSWAEGEHLLSSPDLCPSPVLGGKREPGDVLPAPHATESPW